MEKDYGWTEPRTHAHEYLLPSVVTALHACGMDQRATILDAGCGSGFITHELYTRGYNNIYGYDAAESGICVARTAYQDIQDHFAVHDAYEQTLPPKFPHEAYDVVLSIEVIEHPYRSQKYLENIHAWLKPGGHLILTTPYHGYLKNLAIALLNKFDRHVNVSWEGGHIKFYLFDTLARQLEGAKMSPVKFAGSSRVPFLWKSMIFTALKQ